MNVFRMPSLGADMESGTLVEWLKHPGDKLTRGDIVAVVDTQKGAIEIEIFEDAVLGKILIQPGTKVPVGEALAELAGGEQPAAPQLPPVAPSVTPLVAAKVAPARPAMEVKPPPVPAMVRGEPAASPAARKLAAERGIDLGGVPGSGPGGAIVYVDVERALKEARPAGERAAAPGRAPGPNLGEMRKAIGAAMSRAKREIPHYYLSHSLDLRPAQTWLERSNADRPPAARILLGALLIRAVAVGLKDMPDFNGFFVDGAYHPSARIHVGAAVSVRGGGLIAPAIHDADRLSSDEVMAKLRDLVGRVRAGRIRGSELSDPTITLSSLGERGVDALYGIIHPPQVALIGVGAPQVRPWVEGGAVVPGRVLTATLAADHRVSDGHRGGLFLAAIAGALESPEAL